MHPAPQYNHPELNIRTEPSVQQLHAGIEIKKFRFLLEGEPIYRESENFEFPHASNTFLKQKLRHPISTG